MLKWSSMPLTLDTQLHKKIKKASEKTGLSERDVIDRAVDTFLTHDAAAATALNEELRDWQNLGFETWRREEERNPQPKYDKR